MPKQPSRTVYPLPTPIDDGSRICVKLWIPNIPGHRQALIGAIHNLAKPYSWANDEAHSALAVGQVWRDVFDNLMAHFYDGCDEETHCITYPPSASFIEWFPNNPYTEPNLVTEGYNAPAWYVATAVSNLVLGTQAGDIVTDLSRFPPGSLPSIVPASGLPRFRLNLVGEGTVTLHLLNILAGSLAQITVDDNLATIRFIDSNRDQIAIPFETATTSPVEIEISSPGEHHIDVIIVSQLNDQVPFLHHGGGLRAVELCGFGVNPSMPTPQFRFNEDCLLQTSADGVNWSTVPGWSEFAAACFQGAPGQPGQDGTPGADGLPGAPGASPEMRLLNGTTVQWRQDDDEPTWTNLFEIPGVGGTGKLSAFKCRYARAFINDMIVNHFVEWLKLVHTAQTGEMPFDDAWPAILALIGYTLEESEQESLYVHLRGLYIDEQLGDIDLEVLAYNLQANVNLQKMATKLACVMGEGMDICPEQVTAYLYRFENWFNFEYWYEATRPVVDLLMYNILPELCRKAGAVFWETCDYECEDTSGQCDDFPPAEPPTPWTHEFNFLETAQFWYGKYGGWDWTTWESSQGWRPIAGNNVNDFNKNTISIYTGAFHRRLFDIQIGFNIPLECPSTIEVTFQETGGAIFAYSADLSPGQSGWTTILPESASNVSIAILRVRLVQDANCISETGSLQQGISSIHVTGYDSDPFV